MTRAVRRIAAVALLCACIAQAGAQSLGRLFFTPEQREAIRQARLRGGSADAVVADVPGDVMPLRPSPADAAGAVPTSAAPPAATLAPAAPREIVLSGILDRAGGRIAWLDGTAVRHGQTWRGHRVEVGARSVRLLRDGAPPRVLGVGQRLDLVTGEVREPLAPDAVRRTPR